MFTNLVSWDADFTYNDPATDPGILKISNDYVNWLADNAKIPDMNINLGQMSTPLKSKFVGPTIDDLAKMLISKEDMDKQWNEYIDKYEKAGLREMIDEVNKVGKEQGVIK